MRNILVVECISTGLNYIEDIIQRGYHPVALLMNADPEKAQNYMKVRKESLERITYDYDIINEQETYEKTLEAVRKYDPAVIIPGSEKGVILANLLAADLGLKGNPRESLDAMTKKNAMQEALRSYGIRSIFGKVVSSAAEAEEFIEEKGLNAVVVKPLESAGSMGVTLCNNKEEALEAVRTLFESLDFYGRPIDKCLVQERIFGTEYVVNTVSCSGKHRVTSVFRYSKMRTEEGGYIYNYAELIDQLEPGIPELMNYALDTASAIGFKYGEIHGEYIIDDKGPVLIEVNCRPMGLSLPADYMNRCTGQHETDSILDAYLDPEKFEMDAAKPYEVFCRAVVKTLIVPKRMEAESMPIGVIAENLRSTYMLALSPDNTYTDFNKTVDLETNGGMVYMIHDSSRILAADLELLLKIEREYFGLEINDGMSRRLVPYKDDEKEDLKELLRVNKCHGSVLLAADEEANIENVLCITPSLRDKVGKGFDNVVISLDKTLMSQNESGNISLIFDLMKRVKRGGRVIISKHTCSYLTYGREGAEVLMQVLGLKVEMIRSGQTDSAVIGRA